MKLHLPKSLLVAALVAMSAVSSFAAEYTVGTITTSQAFPSSSGNIWTPGTADGSLTLGTGDWLGAKDANGNRITSFGKQQWDYSGIFGIGKWTQKSSGTVTQNAQFSTLTINGGAQVVLGGQYVSTKLLLGTTAGSMAEYTGVIADHVVVNGDGSTTNLNTWNLTTDTLVVNSGKVQIHNQVQSGNNHFVYELPDSKQVRIHEGLTVNGGEVIINLNSLNSSSSPNSNPNDTHIFTGFGTINFDAPSYEEGSIVDASKASIVKSWITQTDGSLVIQGKTASVGGLNINQTGGNMSVSTNAAGNGSHCWHILSDFGDSSINQGGDAGTVLNIGGIAAYNSKYSDIKSLMTDKGVVFDPLRNEAEYNGEVMDLNASVSIDQTGSGTINIIQGIDLNNYHENKNGVASTQSSTISQSGGGIINLGGTYKGASFDIIQNGNGGVINLKGSMNGGTISQSVGTLNVAANASMTADSVSVGGVFNVAEGGVLNSGVITVTEGGTLINNGVISSTSAAMLAADDEIAALANDDMLIVIAGGFMENYGQTDKNILVQDGGTLTLGENASVGGVEITGGNINVNGDVTVSGALTLSGGTVTFMEDAVITLADGAEVAIDGASIVVKLSDASLDSLVNGGVYTLFDTTSDLEAIDGSTMTFVGTSGDTITTTVNYAGEGAVELAPVVPEPTTATLSLLALAGLAARRRRK